MRHLLPWLSTTLHRLWRTGYTRSLLLQYDASAARAAPSPLVDGPVVKVVHVPQVHVVEKTIEIPQLQTIGKIVGIPEIQSVQSTQTSESLDIITPAPKEFVKTVLHEIDQDLCRDDLEEICYVARMSRKRIWRRVWHGRSTPSDASKSERSWRRLSKCLCYEEEFDEMKRTCAYCGMFEDEDDILVRCQGPDCSLRSADCELPGVFHGRCAAAGHSGGAQWQNCPGCPPAKLATAIGVEVSDSAVLCEYIENSDKPEGLSAVINEKHESDEYVCGKWASDKGESSIFWDCNMNCLSFEEPADDSG